MLLRARAPLPRPEDCKPEGRRHLPAGKQDYGKPTVQGQAAFSVIFPEEGVQATSGQVQDGVLWLWQVLATVPRECRAPKKVGAGGGPPKK
jgi:hypothetical protein